MAITKSSVAKIFAAPQVSVSARPIILKESQQNKITTNNSNKVSSPFIAGGFHLGHVYANTKLFQILRFLFLLFQKFDYKNSFAYRHQNHLPTAGPSPVHKLIVEEKPAIINGSLRRIELAISAKSAK